MGPGGAAATPPSIAGRSLHGLDLAESLRHQRRGRGGPSRPELRALPVLPVQGYRGRLGQHLDAHPVQLPVGVLGQVHAQHGHLSMAVAAEPTGGPIHGSGHCRVSLHVKVLDQCRGRPFACKGMAQHISQISRSYCLCHLLYQGKKLILRASGVSRLH